MTKQSNVEQRRPEMGAAVAFSRYVSSATDLLRPDSASVFGGLRSSGCTTMGVRQRIANQSSPIHPPQHRGINKLTDAKCRSFASHHGTDQKKKLFDGAGLYLTHTRAGLPVWRIKYRYGRVERTYTIGAYRGVSLESARAERDTVRAQLREGEEQALLVSDPL